jgi:uncharacterized protein with GYD domain
MAMYVVLANFTDQGVRNVKDSTKRAEAFKELAKSSGATLAKAGNVRTQTLRAFSQAEMGSILSKVG